METALTTSSRGTAHVAVRDIDAYHVRIDEGEAMIEFDGRRFHSPDAYARIGGYFARGSYTQDLRTREYRFLLDGRLRPLAVGSQQRVTYVPGIEQVPGMAELIPGTDMDMEFWYCISAPAGTPPEVATALHRATVGAAAVPSYREKLLPLGFDVVTDASPAAFTSFMRDQEALWRDLVAVSGVKLD
jgi:hypothetical protein